MAVDGTNCTPQAAGNLTQKELKKSINSVIP
jgi:hypothetical protein